MRNEKRKCKNCNKEFIPKRWNHFYCGSKTNKVGCSYIEHLKRIKEFNLGKGKKNLLEIIKRWHKKQRKENTLYAQNQRQAKRAYYQTEHGREIRRLSNKRNIKNKLENNRKRQLLKKGIIGFHTNQQWENIKKQYNYCCVKCGISEKELTIKFKGTSFIKLTRDHIKAVSRGGSDFIINIQPLCVSCNSRKHAKEI